MKTIEFYKLENDGSQSVLATCSLDESGIVTCEGDKNLVKSLENEGILNYAEKDQPVLFPKDGIKFLEQLRFNFKSGYLNASEIKEL